MGTYIVGYNNDGSPIYGQDDMNLFYIQQQQMMQQQAMQRQGMGMPQQPFAGGMNPMGIPQQYPYRQRATTKKDILAYLQNYTCASEVEQVVSFDTPRARHICRGCKEIVLLDKQVIPVATSSGGIGVEVFFCVRCRKLLINSQSLEVY